MYFSQLSEDYFSLLSPQQVYGIDICSDQGLRLKISAVYTT